MVAGRLPCACAGSWRLTDPKEEAKTKQQGDDEKLNAKISQSGGKVFRCGWMYKEGA